MTKVKVDRSPTQVDDASTTSLAMPKWINDYPEPLPEQRVTVLRALTARRDAGEAVDELAAMLFGELAPPREHNRSMSRTAYWRRRREAQRTSPESS